MITLDNLTYRYNESREALSDVTTRIAPGIHLLLGENGAGKTTLLHVLGGLLIPDVPTECLIDGVAPGWRLPSTMRRIFFVSDDMKFPFASLKEMVSRHAPFYPDFDAAMLQRNLAMFGMDGSESRESFSLGNRKKAMLAYALSLRPEILLLDEPANGLDITAKQQALTMISECIGDSQTVVLSTHTVADFVQLFDSVMLLSAGRLILNLPVWEIVERLDFVSSQLPPAGALYIEQSFGRFLAVVPHEEGTEITDINYTLLYNALQNVSSRHRLITLLSSNPETEQP